MSANISANELNEKLFLAAARGDASALRTLIVSGADVHATNEQGFTAFNVATQHGHSEAAMTILAGREYEYAKTLGVDPSDYFDLETKQISEKKQKSSAS